MQKRLFRTIQRTIKHSPINEHRTSVSLYHFKPKINAQAFVHPSATICGEVFICPTVQVWQNTVIRGDMNEVSIDTDTIIMENCSISTVPSILNSGEVAEVSIGINTVIGPGCSLVSCKIEDDCYIGAGSIICEGSVVDSGSIIGPGSVVPPNRYIPSGQLWAGNPARFVKIVDKPDKVALIHIRKNFESHKEMYDSEMLDQNSAYIEAEILNTREQRASIYAPGELEERLTENK